MPRSRSPPTIEYGLLCRAVISTLMKWLPFYFPKSLFD